MGFMLPMMGMSLLSNLLGRKDGGSIPPSNAKARMGSQRLVTPAGGIFGIRPAAKKKGGAVPKKRGGAVKKKSKPKK
jgi:hypothetical protein